MAAGSLRTPLHSLVGVVVALIAFVAGTRPLPAQLSIGGSVTRPTPATKSPQQRPTQSQGSLTPDEQKRFAGAMNHLTPKERKRLAKKIKKLTPEESRQFIQSIKRQLAAQGATPQNLRRAK